MHLWKRSWFAPVVLVVVVVGGLLGLTLLGSQVSGILSTVGSSVGGPGEVSGGDTTGGDTSSGADPGDPSGGTGSGSGSVIDASVRDDLLIIKTGTLTLQVDDIVAAVTAATQRIDALNGYVSGSEKTGAGDEARATIAFRVPAARWDEALSAIRGLPGEIVEERSATEDVTSQVVDLGARIRNLQGTEQARQAIIQNIRETGMKLSGANADAMAIAGAIARFVELPGGTLNIKLTPKDKVPVMQLAEMMKTNPMLALARFQVEAGNGR